MRDVALISETSNRPRRRQPPTYSLQCLSYSLIPILIWQISDMKFSLPEWITLYIQTITLMSVICQTCEAIMCWHEMPHSLWVASSCLSGISLVVFAPLKLKREHPSTCNVFAVGKTLPKNRICGLWIHPKMSPRRKGWDNSYLVAFVLLRGVQIRC